MRKRNEDGYAVRVHSSVSFLTPLDVQGAFLDALTGKPSTTAATPRTAEAVPSMVAVSSTDSNPGIDQVSRAEGRRMPVKANVECVQKSGRRALSKTSSDRCRLGALDH